MIKGAVHAALGTLAVACLAYNIAAYLCRTANRQHLTVNICLYGALTAYELRAIRHHRQACG